MTRKAIKNTWFLIENKLPMTQLIFNTIMDMCMESGEETDELFFRMLEEYPDFASVYVEKIDKEVAEANIPPMSEEMSERIKQGIYAKIRERFGEDAI